MLITENPNSLGFNSHEIQIDVLGGLNDARLDTMRVTLKVNRNGFNRPLRHSLNLYNNREVESFIEKLSYHFEYSDVKLRACFIKLTEALEDYRLTQQSESDAIHANQYELSDDDHQKAMKLLTSENLLDTTNEHIGNSGIVGEDVNRLLMYLIFTSRKTDKPLHVVSLGGSGVGKTHLQSKVAELVPVEDKVEITQLSANALYYLPSSKLKNKLLLIEDLDGAEDGLLPLRELQSKQRISKSVVQKSIGGKGTTNNLIVEGPVCVAGCTTQESLYEDNANRSFLLYIDESPEQDERIMVYQRRIYAGKVNECFEKESARLLQNAQRLLKPIKVINPYAEWLVLPKTVFKPRRTNLHYLQLIEVITFYHQHQREEQIDVETGEVFIETTLEDIQLANELIKVVLLRKSDRLNGVTRDYLESLRGYLAVKGKETFTNQEIRAEFRISETTLRRYHKLLLTEGYMVRVGGSKTSSYEFRLSDVDEFADLEASIKNALNLCLESATSPKVRHKQNGEA